MKILLTTRETIWGGGEELLINLARQLVRNGHDVVLAVRKESVLREKAEGFAVVDYRARVRADVIICNDFHTLWVRGLSQPLTRKVFIVHGWWQTSRTRNLVARIIGSEIGVVSESVRERLLASGYFAREHVKLLSLGPDWERFRPPSDDERAEMRQRLGIASDSFCCAFVGRLQRLKRPEMFVRAALAAVATPILVTPSTARNDDEAARLESLSEAAARSEIVHLPSSEVREALWASDVFVSTSEFESLGLAMMEAMACGLPVVTTAIGGPCDYILDQKTGFLVSDDEELTETLIRLRHDLRLRRAVGIAGRDAIRHRTFDVVIRELIG